MARYIDLDKCNQYRTNHGGYPDTFAFPPWTEFEDVAPVVHAHWKRNFQRQGVYKDLWLYCSNCNGRTSEEYAPYWWLYCPYCGAKMDEEVEK